MSAPTSPGDLNSLVAEVRRLAREVKAAAHDKIEAQATFAAAREQHLAAERAYEEAARALEKFLHDTADATP